MTRHLKRTGIINGVSFSGFNGHSCLLQPHFVIYAARAFLHKILISAAVRQLMTLTMFWA